MADQGYHREWVRELPKEASRWVNEGLISEDQRTRIVALYPAEAGNSRDRTVMIISILGSLLVGAGVILFFASNWEVIPAAIKVGMIITAVVAAYGSGYYLQFVSGNYPRIGQSLIVLGALLYGAGIWLIAQIFHLDSRFPNGFLFWGIGVLPVAWAVGSRPVLYLATLILGIWTITEQTEFQTFNVLFPVIAAAALLPMARQLKSVLVEAAVVVGLFIWFALNLVHTETDGLDRAAMFLVARTMIVYGVAVFTLGLARLGDLRAYLGVGSIIALLGTYILSFTHNYYGQEQIPVALGGSAYLVTGTTIFLLVALAAGWKYLQSKDPVRAAVLGALGLFVVGGFTAHLMPDVYRVVGANFLLLGGAIAVVVMGIYRRSELLVNLGLVVFVVHLLTRYLDLFFDAMDKSLFFILGGVLLLGGGWLLERNRRRWIGDMGGGSNE